MAVLVASFWVTPRPDPKDLYYWAKAAGDKDWSAEAAQSNPEAQFYLGLTLIRTNLMKMVDRVPMLSAVPVIGKRLFENVSYGLDNNIAQEQLIEAYRWIKKSADQGFAPARQAEKLFPGRITGSIQSNQTIKSSHQPPQPK